MGDSAVSAIRSERTVCGFCSCGCGLYLTGAAGGLEGVGPSAHHPVSHGRLCARGWAAHEATLWGPRLRAPLVRRNGELRPTGWKEALTAAVAGLARLRDAGRPVGLLASGRASNEESFLAVALARSGLKTGHLDAGLRRSWEALVRGLADVPAFPVSGPSLPAVEGSDLVVVVGEDPAVTHPRLALAVLRAVRRGARLVTVGWQQGSLAPLATEHVALDPVAPLTTLAGLRASGVPGGMFDGARRPAFLVSAFDSDPTLLRQAAASVARLAVWLAEGGRAEPLVLPLPIRSNTRGSLEMGVAPGMLPGPLPLADAGARVRLGRLWGDACWEEGLGAEEMAGEVAGLLVLGEDVPAVHPSPAQVREQLAALEHLVVVDAFMTETAAQADVVLPAAAFGEAEGTVTGLARRAQVQHAYQAPGEGVRQGWEVLAELLAALGSPFHPATLGAVRSAIAESVPTYEAMAQSLPEDGWALACPDAELVAAFRPSAVEPGRAPAGAGSGPASARASGQSPSLVLRRMGTFDWNVDPLVRFSPTLRRDPVSLARRFPDGLVIMSPDDATSLGVRDGWTVRLQTAHGQTRAGVRVTASVAPGMLLVPYASRERLGALLGADGVAEVEVQSV